MLQGLHPICLVACTFGAADSGSQPELATVHEMMELAPAPPSNKPGIQEGPRTRAPTRPADLVPAHQPPAAAVELAPEPAPREWFGHAPWRSWERLTGDWGGARTALEERGLTLDASLVWEYGSVWSGGLAQRASDRTLWDFALTADLDALSGWKGAQIYCNAYVSESSGGSEDVGDFQGISNIDTYGDRAQIAELWFEQYAFDNILRVKVGKIDANTEFAYNESGADFFHASSGFSPTIAYFPSFPEPATGIVTFIYPTERWYIGVGWFDGSLQDGVNTGKRGPDQFFKNNLSSDWFFSGETGVSWKNMSESLGAGRAAVGFNHATGRLETFSGDEQQGMTSYHVTLEQMLWSRAADGEGAHKGLASFWQGGLSDESTHQAHLHLATGLVLSGFCEARPDDTTGCYVSWVDFTDEEGSDITGQETAIEVYYKLQLTPAVSVTPDLQYIIDPSGNSGTDDALVAQVRIVINF